MDKLNNEKMPELTEEELATVEGAGKIRDWFIKTGEKITKAACKYFDDRYWDDNKGECIIKHQTPKEINSRIFKS